MSTSHYASRPAQNDVGAETIRITRAPENTRRRTRLTATIWLFVGIALLIADGTAICHFADGGLDVVILAILTLPTSAIVILAALEARK